MRVGTGFIQQFFQGSTGASASRAALLDPAAERLAQLTPGVIQTEQQELRSVRESQLNASTAISFTGAAQQHLQTIRTRLEEMQGLAQAAADPAASFGTRQGLQQQAGQLIGRLETFAITTNHNGRKIFDGSLNNIVLQTGTGQHEREILSLPSMRPSVLGARAIHNPEQGVDAAPLATGEVRINGSAVPESTEAGAAAKAAAINAIREATGVSATALETTLRGAAPVQSAYLDGSASALTINGMNIGGVVVVPGDANGALRGTVARYQDLTGVAAQVDADGRLTLRSETGSAISIRATGSAARDLGLTLDARGEAQAAGHIALSSAAAFTLSDPNGRIGTPTMLQTVQLDLTTSIEFTNLTDAAGARDAITSAETALQRVDKAQARLTAVQGSLTAFNSVLARKGETIGGVAELKIAKAQDALETARAMQAEILRDGATSFRAQANVTPRRALELLRG